MADTTTSGISIRQRVRTLFNYSLSAILTFLFLFLAFRGTDTSALLMSIRQADYVWLLCNFAFLIASHVLRAMRWRYLLQPIKPGITLRNLFSSVMIGYMMNNVLPRAGELARPYAIGKVEAISKTAAFGTIVVERIMDTVTFLLLVAALPILYRGPLKESFPWLMEAGLILAGFMVPAIAALLLMMTRRDWTDRVLGVLTRFVSPRLAKRISSLVHQFLDGFLFVKNPGSFAAIFILSVLIWFFYAVMTYIAFYAFGLGGNLGFNGALVVLAISSIGVAIPTPGATGSYHVFTSQTLIRLYGVDQVTALSYATLTHAVGFIGVTIIGLYYFFRDRISFSEAMGSQHTRSAELR